MNMDERERRFLEKIRSELDAGAENLDRETLRRLHGARVTALAEVERRRTGWLRIPRWVTAGGVATAAVVVVAVSIWLAEPRQTLPARQAEDLEILTAQEHLEMYKDLEFYRWLADADNGR